ncbi:hypothetical protein NEOLEDRAFT_1056503 [Neolentinus lepideus HHB14362 ss-1]|uniref:Uncharacterized protein n=1 Tax=Neolentinus lepideus HHB14362 ss-1 TaxID=1314782 RepID=A0A165VC59_9AGAM|nr:hypothetical protein NEOLEDRAFT_1056503 [Neolentinus lepideus HHB14362 ss-1]
MSSNQSTDTLPSSIPKPEASGVNWAIFAKRFEKAVRSKQLWGHFSGTTMCPIPAGDTATTEEETAIHKWTDDEATADYLLTQKLPDSAFLKVQHRHTVAERCRPSAMSIPARGSTCRWTCTIGTCRASAH